MLKVSNLQKRFSSADQIVTPVKDVTFTLETGAFAAIIGKSGSGKSTLLSLLGALDRPTSGSIEVDDINIAKLSDAKLTAYRRGDIGFVFQQYNLVPNLTALENVMLPMEFAGVANAARRERAAKLLEQVGLDAEKQTRRPTRLSGGEQQRVAIARALLKRPALILADEPTGELDTITGQEIFAILRRLQREFETTIVTVTHDHRYIHEEDLVLRIQDGQIA